MLNEEAATKAPRTSLHGHWSSRMAFILAVTGSAVGLGNIWKFPYIAGENGGGAFVLVYLLCVFLIGLPVMMSEILIGRRGRRNPVATMALLGEEEGHSRRWRWVGALGILTGILILSYYSVIAGWTLAYVQKSVFGVFAGATAAQVDAVFKNFTGSWFAVGIAHTLFIGFTTLVVARGVERGLEQAVKFMVPSLLLLMLTLLGYSITSGSFAAGLSFLFSPDFSALTWDGVLAAMGQAFFTLSLGMGAVMAYGAYLPKETSIAGASIAVVIADTVIAILAALVIFPLVFANNLDPAELGLMESAVAYLVERFYRTRAQAALMIGGLIWAIGLGTVLSFNVLMNFRFLKGTIYNNVDYLTSNILLPASGLLITVFAAWVMCRNSTSDELGGAGSSYRLWHFLARFVAPAAIIVIFLQAVGAFG